MIYRPCCPEWDRVEKRLPHLSACRPNFFPTVVLTLVRVKHIVSRSGVEWEIVG